MNTHKEPGEYCLLPGDARNTVTVCLIQYFFGPDTSEQRVVAR